MATMATVAGTANQIVGKVFIIYGTVKAVSPDGTVRLLAPNSPIYADDRIITESDGSVSIQFDGPHVTQLDLGRMTQIIIDEDVYAGVAPDAVSDAAAEAEQIRQSLLQGDQPIDLEATAAGGDSGSSNTVFNLPQTGGEVTPGSGADTSGTTTTTEGTAGGTTTFTAMPDFVSAKEGGGTATEGNVLANDLSGHGPNSPMTVTAVDGSATKVGAAINTPAGGSIIIHTDGSYTYTAPAHVTNVDGAPVQDVIPYTVTNSDGIIATSTLTIQITDTAPVAVEDKVAVSEDGGGNVIHGNVLANDDLSSADVPNTFVAWGSSEADNAAIVELAKYSTLTLNADGSYTFELNNSSAAVQALTSQDTITKSINYTVTDADGSQSSAQLTITITGADDSAHVTVATEGHVVYEHGLTSVYDTSETVDGSFAVSATDGIAKITVEGTELTLAQLQELSTGSPAVISTGEGTLELTAYSGDAFGGTVSYIYTVKEVQHPSLDPTLTDSVAFKVEGIGGTTGTATLAINIVDDVPIIPAGPYYVTAYDGSGINTTLNVIAGDKITFNWSFDAHDAKPYNDFGFVVVNGHATKLADIGQVGSNNATGWETFSYVATANGPLQIGFGVTNTGDEMSPSHLLIDKLAVNDIVKQSFESGNLTGWQSTGSVAVVTTHDAGVYTPSDGGHMVDITSSGADKGALELFFGLPAGAMDTVSETAGALYTPTYTMALDAFGLTGGLPDVEGHAGELIVTTGTLAHSYGADGAGTVLLTGVMLPPNLGFTQTISADGLTLTISEDQGGNAPVAVLEIALEDNTSGSYLVTQLHAIDHPGENVAFTVQYQVTDSDGDTVYGHAGNDVIYAGAGGETLIGGIGNDHFVGGDGIDNLSGGDGTDIIEGKAGNDTLDGGAGRDFLSGGAGNDILIGGAGNNILTGGTGADTFKVGEGNDHITDYSKAEGDKVDISHMLNTPDPDHTRLGVIDNAGKADLVIYDNDAHSNIIGSVTFDNIDYSSLTPDQQLTSLLGQVDLDHTV